MSDGTKDDESTTLELLSALIDSDEPVLECKTENTACTCRSCGFKGKNMIVVDHSPKEQNTICRECHVYEDPRHYAGDFVLAWIPDYSRQGISLLAKLLPLTLKSDVWAKIAYHSDPDTFDLLEKWHAIQHLGSFMSYDKKAAGSKTSQRREKFGAQIKKSLDGIGKVFANGIERANRIFEGASINDVLDAIEIMGEKERAQLEIGLRFIPKEIQENQLTSGETSALHEAVFDALTKDLAKFGVSGETDGALLEEPSDSTKKEADDIPEEEVSATNDSPAPAELTVSSPPSTTVRKNWLKRLIVREEK